MKLNRQTRSFVEAALKPSLKLRQILKLSADTNKYVDLIRCNLYGVSPLKRSVFKKTSKHLKYFKSDSKELPRNYDVLLYAPTRVCGLTTQLNQLTELFNRVVYRIE